MKFQFILFLTLFIGVLALLILSLWFSTNTFFHITSAKAKTILLLVLFFLTFLMPFSMVLERFRANFFARGIYFLSTAWIGFFIHLIIAVIAVWLVLIIAKFFSFQIDIKIVATIFFSFSIICAIYGLLNARNVRVTNVEVPMSNLASQWEGKKIIQLSDLHLGAIYGKGFLEQVASKVNAENPEVIFITGDLFDGTDGNIDTMADSLNKFKSKYGVYFITGNHETYLGLEKALNVLKQTNIKVLNDEVIDINGLQVIGIGYPAFGTSKNIRDIIKPNDNYFAEKPTILLHHAPTSIDFNGDSSHTSAYWKPDLDFSYAKEIGINLQLSGHGHAGQFFPFTCIAHSIYKGYDYGLHTDGDFSIFTTSGTGTWGPPMRTGSDSEIVVIKLVSKS
ncbi:metallophosphoesterase [Candidatus Peregrinibacteria bacterium]|nr:metallophosphoesterase [Candidatus Peregrinibacteria bacterium]